MKQARGASIPRYQVCYLTPSSRGEILGWKSMKIMKILKNQWLLHQIQWFSWKSVTNKIFCVRFVHNLQSSVINIFWWFLFCGNRTFLPYDVTFCDFRFEFSIFRFFDQIQHFSRCSNFQLYTLPISAICCVRFVHNLQSRVINIFWWFLFCSNRTLLPYDVTFCVFRFEFSYFRIF